jgi:hypothetical protein
VSTHYFRFTLRGAAERQRAPAVEQLLARADSAEAVSEWRAQAFRRIAPDALMPGVAAAALYAARGSVAGASVFVATPVHYAADMSSVRLVADGMLSLQQAQVDELAADFNRVWRGSGIRLIAGRSAELYCVLDQALDATTHDPEAVLGKVIENFLPTGQAAGRLRTLMSEIEMWLFEHAVNFARTSLPAVTGLWLWGGGPVVQSLPRVSGWSKGNDVFFRAFGAAAAPHAVAGTSGVAVIGAQPGAESDTEKTWLADSIAQWRAGRVARLELSAGSRCVSIGARGRRRFWRRARPWWEHFE